MKRFGFAVVLLTATAALAVGLSGALGASASAGRGATVATASSKPGWILVDGHRRTL